MLGHMIKTTGALNWGKTLTDLISSRRPYNIDCLMLEDAGAYCDIKVYPNELQSSVYDYAYWICYDPDHGDELLATFMSNLADERVEDVYRELGCRN